MSCRLCFIIDDIGYQKEIEYDKEMLQSHTAD